MKAALDTISTPQTSALIAMSFGSPLGRAERATPDPLPRPWPPCLASTGLWDFSGSGPGRSIKSWGGNGHHCYLCNYTSGSLAPSGRLSFRLSQLK